MQAGGTMDWNKLKLAGDPILVVGLRKSSKLEPYRVMLDQDLNDPLRKVASEAVKAIAARKAVPYTPYVSPGANEYLILDPATLTITVEESDSDGAKSEREQTAELVETVVGAAGLPVIGAAQLINRLEDLYFQAVCVPHDGGIVGCVTKTAARQQIKRSAIPLGKDNKLDRFKRITRPEVVLESEVHAAVAPDEVAILNRTQFQFLVGDIGLVTQYVPKQVKRISDQLSRRGIKLNSKTRKSLEARAIESIQIAKRLDAFSERVKVVDMSRITSGAGFTDQDLKKHDFVNAKGEIACDASRVVELLDALEGRFFTDAFSSPASPEQRRADNFRKRT